MKEEIIKNELLSIKKLLLTIEKNGITIGGWLPKHIVLRFFDYSDNQLRNLERTSSIEVSKIGRRKFYSLESIIKIIEKNRI
jgi:hypothetical protein